MGRTSALLFVLALVASGIALAACSLSSLDDLKGGAETDASVPDASTTGDAGSDAQTLACGAGTKQCGNECVSDDSPQYGCGSVGCFACSLAHVSSASCATDGSCSVGACEAGWGDCDETLSGCETSLNAPGHCGDCGKSCGANEVCASGSCTTSCPSGTTNCNGSCTDVASDAQNCGTCGNVCSAPDGAVGVCQQGTCNFACNGGYTKCGDECRDTQNDWQHCGGCGLVCGAPNSIPACNGGTCTLLCQAGWENCDGNPANGCETSLTSLQHCGACNSPCPTGPNGTAICKGGACGFTCNPGFGDCTAASGCETNLNLNPLHCGACFNECPCTCQNGICNTGRSCR